MVRDPSIASRAPLSLRACSRRPAASAARHPRLGCPHASPLSRASPSPTAATHASGCVPPPPRPPPPPPRCPPAQDEHAARARGRDRAQHVRGDTRLLPVALVDLHGALHPQPRRDKQLGGVGRLRVARVLERARAPQRRVAARVARELRHLLCRRVSPPFRSRLVGLTCLPTGRHRIFSRARLQGRPALKNVCAPQASTSTTTASARTRATRSSRCRSASTRRARARRDPHRGAGGRPLRPRRGSDGRPRRDTHDRPFRRSSG